MRDEYSIWRGELAGTEFRNGRWIRARQPFPLFLAAGGLALAGALLALALARALS